MPKNSSKKISKLFHHIGIRAIEHINEHHALHYFRIPETPQSIILYESFTK